MHGTQTTPACVKLPLFSGPDLPSLRDGITGAIEQRTSHRKRPPPNRFHVSGCADGQDKIYPPSEMAALMAASDYVVMATPYTPATHQMVNAEALSAMRPTAVFINIGRGKCVDEEALVAGEGGGLLPTVLGTRGVEGRLLTTCTTTCSTREDTLGGCLTR